MFVRFFRIKASEGLEKSLVGAIYKEKNRDKKKRALDYLRMPKLQEIFTTVQSTPDNSNLQGKLKKVRVIGSSKKIAESKVKTVFTAQ